MSYISTLPCVVIPQAEDIPVIVLNQANNIKCNNGSTNYLLFKCQQSPQADTANPQTLLNRPISIIDSNKTYLNNLDTRDTEAAEALVMLQDCGKLQLENRQQIGTSNNDQAKVAHADSCTHQIQVEHNTKFNNKEIDNVFVLIKESFEKMRTLFIEKRGLQIPDKLEEFENKLKDDFVLLMKKTKEYNFSIDNFFRNLMFFYETNAEKEQQCNLNIIHMFLMLINGTEYYRIRWKNIIFFASLPKDKIKIFLKHKPTRKALHEADPNTNYFVNSALYFENINYQEQLNTNLIYFAEKINCTIHNEIIKDLFKTQIDKITALFLKKNIEINNSILRIFYVMIQYNTRYKYERFEKIFFTIITRLQKISDENNFYYTNMIFKNCKNISNLDDIEKLLGCQLSDNHELNSVASSSQTQIKEPFYTNSQNNQVELLKALTEEAFKKIRMLLVKEKKLKIPDKLELLKSKITNYTSNAIAMIKKHHLDIDAFFEKLILFYKFNAEKEQKYSLNIIPVFMVLKDYNHPDIFKSYHISWGNIVNFAAIPNDKIKHLLDNKNICNAIHEICNEPHTFKSSKISFENFDFPDQFTAYLQGYIYTINCKIKKKAIKNFFETKIKEIINLLKIKNIRMNYSFSSILYILINNHKNHENEILKQIFIKIIKRLQEIPDENNFYNVSMIFKVSNKHQMTLEDIEKLLSCQPLDNNVCDSFKKRRASIDIDDQPDQPKCAKYSPTNEITG